MDSDMTPASIGVIQGRLSKPVGNKIQAFPAQTWQDEFALAKDAGLDAVEWIFEDPIAENPLWQAEGRARIKQIMEQTGVKIFNVCADYFMEHPFFRVPDTERLQSIEILKQIIPLCREIEAGSLEIPLLDNSRIETDAERDFAVAAIKEALPIAQKNEIALAFETSLPPDKFAEFLNALDHPLVKVVYDIGNSAQMGYDPAEELAAYGKYLSNVHIKDRVLGGGTVPLGQGNADFNKVFGELKNLNYQGHITLQVARGESGQELKTTKSHLEFLKKYL